MRIRTRILCAAAATAIIDSPAGCSTPDTGVDCDAMVEQWPDQADRPEARRLHHGGAVSGACVRQRAGHGHPAAGHGQIEAIRCPGIPDRHRAEGQCMTLSKWVTWALIVLAVLAINAAVVAGIAGITFALGRTAYQPTVSVVPPCIPSVGHC